MKIVLTDKQKVTVFADIFKNLKNIVDEANIIFNNDYLYMQGMDSTHALLVDLKLDSSWFDTYEVENDDDTEIDFGIHCETLFKILNCLKEDQKITIEDISSSHSLKITFDGGDQIKKEFELSTIQLDNDLMEIPDVEYETDMCFTSNQFSELIKETAIFNDVITFNCSQEKVMLNASGDLGKMKAFINQDDIIMYSILEDTIIDVNYSISFLDNVCGFQKLNKEVMVHASEDKPMKIQYRLDDKSFDDEESPSSYCKFFIAPKIID
jgi:proliferating cell nuclear antigen PCNA